MIKFTYIYIYHVVTFQYVILKQFFFKERLKKDYNALLSSHLFKLIEQPNKRFKRHSYISKSRPFNRTKYRI